MDKFNGTWEIPAKIPNDFFQILKETGYNRMERQIFKRSKVLIHSCLKDDDLTLKIDSMMYKKSYNYKLNGDPIEFIDDNKNKIIEISNWIDENTVQTKTIYPDKGVTILDTRKLLDSGDCLHKIVYNNRDIEKDIEKKIETEIVYPKIKNKNIGKTGNTVCTETKISDGE